MLFKRTLALIVFMIVLPLTAAAIETTVETIDHAVQIGESTVTLREYKNGSGPTFIRVHYNETDAGDVGEKIVAELGGRFIDLVHQGGRYVTFKLDGAKFWFDPNRIFTKEGIARTVRGQKKDARALDAVQGLADAIIKLCGKASPLVALHNNGGHGFGLMSYEVRGQYFRGSGKTLLHHGSGGAQNFVVVTTTALFETFKKRNISAVYQDPKFDLNDGSLSYRFGSEGRAYINVETLLGERALQMTMVRDIHRMIMGATTAQLEMP